MSDAAYVALLDDLDAEEASLDTTVADLDERGWSTPTPAEGWTVRDSIAHLAATEMWATLALTDPDGFRAELAGIAADAERRADEVRTGLMFRRPPPDVDTLTWWRDTGSSRSAAPGSRPGRPPPVVRSRHVEHVVRHGAAHGDVGARCRRARRPRCRHRAVGPAASGGRARRPHPGVPYVVRGREAPDVAVRVELDAPDGTLWTWGDAGAPASVRGAALDFCLVVTQRRNGATRRSWCRARPPRSGSTSRRPSPAPPHPRAHRPDSGPLEPRGTLLGEGSNTFAGIVGLTRDDHQLRLACELILEALAQRAAYRRFAAPSAPVGPDASARRERLRLGSEVVVGHDRVTRPHACASAAVRTRFVSARSSARVTPTSRGRYQVEPPSGTSPIPV